MEQWFHIEPSLEVLSRTFLPFKGADKNPPRFHQEPLSVPRVLSGINLGGSIENLFIVQRFYLEHIQQVLLRTVLYYGTKNP